MLHWLHGEAEVRLAFRWEGRLIARRLYIWMREEEMGILAVAVPGAGARHTTIRIQPSHFSAYLYVARIHMGSTRVYHTQRYRQRAS